jgi:Protein of unknown function (DUF3551)
LWQDGHALVTQRDLANPVFISPGLDNGKEVAMRRRAVIFGSLMLAFLINARSSAAQEFRAYPWCLFTGGSEGGIEMCSFDSFDQCLLTRSGGGGICFANPAYSGVAEPPALATEPGPAVTEPRRQTRPPRGGVNERRRT